MAIVNSRKNGALGEKGWENDFGSTHTCILAPNLSFVCSWLIKLLLYLLLPLLLDFVHPFTKLEYWNT